MHFETALKMTDEYFHKCNVIDFGCADGPFLPSLAEYFNYVTGIDKESCYIEIGLKLCNEMCLNNVELVNNDNLTIKNLKSKISHRKYHILYLLETIEHIGNKDYPYKSRIDFLKKISTLINKKGFIVMSVPKMTGIPFLIQRIGLALSGIYREPISLLNMIKAGFFNDTTELEKQWNHYHLGFNHKKLERYLTGEFKILDKKDIFFQVVYLIRRET